MSEYHPKKRRMANRKYFRTKIDTSQIAQAEGRVHNQQFLNELNSLIGVTGVWGREVPPKKYMQIMWIVAPKWMAQTAFETLSVTQADHSQELISDLAFEDIKKTRHHLPAVLYDSIPDKHRFPEMRESPHGDRRCRFATRLWRNQYRPIIDERKKLNSIERYELFTIYDRCVGKGVPSRNYEACQVHSIKELRDWDAELKWLNEKYVVWMEWKKQGRILTGFKDDPKTE